MCPINHSYIQYSMKIEYIFHWAKYISQKSVALLQYSLSSLHKRVWAFLVQ